MSNDTESEGGEELLKKAVITASSGAAGGFIGTLVAGSVGGAVGGVVSSLIPLLADIPAAKRHEERVGEVLRELEVTLAQDIGALNLLTDSQFKVLSETVDAIFRTTEYEKIEFLKTIAIRSVSYKDYVAYEAILLSRIVRDITSEELKFLLENFSFNRVHVHSWSEEEHLDSTKKLNDRQKLKDKIRKEKGKYIELAEPEALIVNGLVGLGVMEPAELSLGLHVFKFSSISVKLLVLLDK